MSEKFSLRGSRPETNYITTNMSLRDAARHSGFNAADYLKTIENSKNGFPPNHRFHNKEYVAKIFWTNIRKTMEYWRQAREYGFDTTIGEAIELRQEGLNKSV